MRVLKRREMNTGYVHLDSAPIDMITSKMPEALLDAVKWAEKEMLDRVILSGIETASAAGVAVSDSDNASNELCLSNVTQAIDQSHIPWIAAINGPTLGNGADLAIACRMRIMTPTAKIGLSAITQGIIPIAGSISRLARLIGLETTIDMVLSGEPCRAEAALAAGLVQAIEKDPSEAAFMINSEMLRSIVPTWELPAPKINTDIFSLARQTCTQKFPGQIAPVRAIDTIETGLSLEFHDAIQNERSTYLELYNSDQARALRHFFSAECAATRPTNLPAASAPLGHVAVIRGDKLGAQIAYSLLCHGVRVTLIETDADGIECARKNIRKLIANKQLSKAIVPRETTDLHAKLTLTTQYEDAAGAMLAIDTSCEALDKKKDVFRRLENILSPNAVLASSISYLNIEEIAADLRNPSRVVGLHFPAPVHTVRLLEITKGTVAGTPAIAAGFALAKMLGKEPVLSQARSGFICNRILAQYQEAADTVFMDGSTPWEVDEAMEAFGYLMGPYEAQDISGIDTAVANRRHQARFQNPDRRSIPIADRMLELGKLGRKTSAGWYRYPGNGGKVDDPIVADLALEEAHFAKIERCDYSPSEIRDRLLLAQINEAADILYEGIAKSARDIDLVSVLGCGFPRWRGGLMHYADTIGTQLIASRIKALATEDPVTWQLSPLLKHCAETGTLLSDWSVAD